MNVAHTIKPMIELDRRISLEDAGLVASGAASLTLAKAADTRCNAAFARLQRAIAENRHVYGVTTGFGPLANRLVSPRHGEILQQNLVYHLASGVGPVLPWTTARAIVLARLVALVQGASGASQETLSRLIALLNSDLAPDIPARGTVGASGDLTPLAHVVLALQGKGGFRTSNGKKIAGETALEILGVTPLDLSHRDGLALVNGTSAMTGIGVLNALRLARALDWSVVLSIAIAEALGARREAWDPALAALRPHAGQVWAAGALTDATEMSTWLERGPLSDRVLTSDLDQATETTAGQDAYTLRCAPQIIGGVADAASWHAGVVETELHSVTDNPVFPDATGPLALHGGNFMGVHIALASDAAAAAVTVLAGFHERQIARITDERLNNGLPAFLSGGPLGLNSGFMGAQVTSTALVAEMRSLGMTSTQSISTNGANQDVVSQGTIAARLLSDRIDLLFQVQAILAMVAVQAIELRERPDKAGLSKSSKSLLQTVREISPFLSVDRPLGPEIERLAARLETVTPSEAQKLVVGPHHR